MNRRKYHHHPLFNRSNFIIMLIGVGLMVLGYITMVGGGYTDNMTPNYDAKYGFQRTVLAPMLILLGLFVNGYAIMKSPSEAQKQDIVENVFNKKSQSALDEIVRKRATKNATTNTTNTTTDPRK